MTRHGWQARRQSPPWIRLAGTLGPGCVALVSACSGEPASAPPIPEWTIVEELRLGSIDDPFQALTRVGSLDTDADGNLYVAQPQDGVIRVFSPGGEPRAVIGGEGEGPGEFEALRSFGFLGDTLYATDPAAGRITFFTKDGGLIRTEPAPRVDLGPDLVSMPPFRLLPGGEAVMSPAVAISVDEDRVPALPFVRIDRTGRILDTLGWRSRERMAMSFSRGAAVMSTMQPFSDGNLLAIGSAPLLVADVDRTIGPHRTFRITVVREGHDTVYAREYAYESVSIPLAHLDSLREDAVRRAERFYGGRRAAEDAVGGALFVPPWLPPVSQCEMSDDGRVWLQREILPGEPRTWLVLDPGGEPVGTFQIPADVEIRLVESGTLWGVVTDALDVPYVVRYRVEGLGAASASPRPPG